MDNSITIPETLYQSLVNTHIYDKRFLAMYIVGSRTRSYIKLPSDFDFLVILSENISYSEASFILNKSIFLNTLTNTPWEISGDTLRNRIWDSGVGIAYIEEKNLNLYLNNIQLGIIVEPEYRIWAVNGYVPEVWFADIIDSVMMFDKSNFIQGWKQKLINYPDKFHMSLSSFLYKELNIKLDGLSMALKEDDMITFNAIYSSSLLPVIRTLFSYEQVYFRGLKHITLQVKALIPQHFILIETLFGKCSSERNFMFNTLSSVIKQFLPSQSHY